MNLADIATSTFPLLKGRTGVETLTKKVPVVIRLYNGVLRIKTHRTKVKCVLSGNAAFIGTEPVAIDYNGIGDAVTLMTIAIDYPFVERIESNMQLPGLVGLGKNGTLTLEPQGSPPALLKYYSARPYD